MGNPHRIIVKKSISFLVILVFPSNTIFSLIQTISCLRCYNAADLLLLRNHTKLSQNLKRKCNNKSTHKSEICKKEV